MSAIAFKEQKRMLVIPIEFKNVKIDALVDSGAYINVISEKDAQKIQKEAKASILEKAPPPPYQNTLRQHRARKRPCHIQDEIQDRRRSKKPSSSSPKRPTRYLVWRYSGNTPQSLTLYNVLLTSLKYNSPWL